MRHFAAEQFWRCFDALPAETQRQARAAFVLLKANPRHPSLRLKHIGEYWSVRVSRKYRALGVTVEGGILWAWIGTHEEYDRILSS